MNARYYNGTQGQFISEDPVFLALGSTTSTLQALSDPQSLNTYSYGRDNPLVKSDPTGKDFNILGFLSQSTQASIGEWLNNEASTNPFVNFALQNPIEGGLSIGTIAGTAFALGAVAAGSAITCGVVCGSTITAAGTTATTVSGELGQAGNYIPSVNLSDLPQNIQDSFAVYEENGWTNLEGYHPYSVFNNNEGFLPEEEDMDYTEFDVNPSSNPSERGLERFVTGDSGEIYYTNTHYGFTGSPEFQLINY